MGLVSEKLSCLGRWSGHQKNSDISLAFSYCYCLLTVILSNILLPKSLLLMIRNWKDDTHCNVYFIHIFPMKRPVFQDFYSSTIST